MNRRPARLLLALAGALLLFALLGALGFWSGTGLYQQVRQALENLPQYMDMLENAMTAFWEHFDAFREQLPEQLQPFLLQFQQGFSDILFALVNQSAPTSLFSAVPHFFLSFFVALISAYFFTKDKALIHRAYLAHVEPLVGFSIGTARKELAASVWGYVKTQLILMAYTFCICIAGMLVLRSPHPLLLSAVTAVIDALPFFGSGFILWPGGVPSDYGTVVSCSGLSGHLRHHSGDAAGFAATDTWGTNWAAPASDTVFHVLWFPLHRRMGTFTGPCHRGDTAGVFPPAKRISNAPGAMRRGQFFILRSL